MSRSRSIFGVCAWLMVASMDRVTPAAAQSRVSIEGIWEYLDVAGRHGQAIYLDGHYAFFLTPVDTSLATGVLPDSVRARLWSALTLDAGTYSVSDTIVTMHRTYPKDPRQIGTTWHWSFAGMKGDTLLYHQLNAAGRANSPGWLKVVRVRPVK